MNNIKKKILFSIYIYLLVIGRGYGQNTFSPSLSKLVDQTEKTTQSNTIDNKLVIAQNRTQIVLSSSYYPVTAGDTYTLTFLANSTVVSYTVVIDSTYKVRVANLGIIDSKGKSYLELKNQVEALVAKNYPMSGVQFVITTPAFFKIIVAGEVKVSKEVEAWALTRLSEFWEEHRTEYSSMREVVIRSSDGREKSYDLFKAWRYGDLSQDPYVRPGDTIIFKKYDRQVVIEGEVKRPGTYQLLAGEGLKDVIEKYADGLTPVADTDRIEVTRYIEGREKSGERIYLGYEAIEKNYELKNWDRVYLRNITDLKPVVFLEGAVRTGETDTVTPEISNKITIQYTWGENYATLVREYRNWFSPVSDTEKAYILREGKRIPLNINPMLYDASYKSEYFVEPYDTLVIPFRQYFVTVAGSVKTPGRYPYVPDRDWSYYIALAGGFDTERNTGEAITIVDMNGKKLRKTDPISPECVITAESNSFLYYFNKFSPPIVTVLSVLSTLLSILAVTGVF